MVTLEHHLKRRQKQSQSDTDEAQSDQPPQKKPRRQFSSRQEANTAFWDSLSRVHLTRSALKELDRRNQLHAGPRQTATVVRPDLSRTQPHFASRLKRFARHGGLDLTDLRGVRLIS